MSRRHLKLVPSPTSLSVVDLGSANGTSKNGHPVTSRTTLEQGDIVRLGDTEIVVLARPVVAKPVAGSRGTVMIRTLGPVAIPKPPPPKPVEVAPSQGRKLRDRVLGIGTDPDKPVFPNFMELPRHIPVPVWQVMRWLSIATYVALVVGLFIRPAGGEFAFFKVIVPAAAHPVLRRPGPVAQPLPAGRLQPDAAGARLHPRLDGAGVVRPLRLRRRHRPVLRDHRRPPRPVQHERRRRPACCSASPSSRPSPWASCSRARAAGARSICPLLPLQRVYGQTPFVTVPNSHCNPCVACTKNCYDFNPRVAYQADLHDPDPGWSAPRKVFVGALPGFVLGFFLLIGNTDLSKPQIIERLALFFLGSIGSFFVLDALLPLSTRHALRPLRGGGHQPLLLVRQPGRAESLKTITGTDITVDPLAHPDHRARAGARSGSSAPGWSRRSTRWRRALPRPCPIKLSAKGAKALQGETEAPAADLVTVRFEPDAKEVGAEAGRACSRCASATASPSRPAAAWACAAPTPSPCSTAWTTSTAPEEEERNTLRRLGFAENTRMACCARLQSGPVTMALTPEPGDASAEKPTEFDHSIASVVVIGNGIAGVTAADFIRRGHPDCEIHLVGGESHVLYNRMGISRLVFGRSAMQGLYLLGEEWYDEHDITAWLNTVATAHRPGRPSGCSSAPATRCPSTASCSPWGARARCRPIPGFEKPGAFVMREAGDAMAIRAYAQQHGARDRGGRRRRAPRARGGALAARARPQRHGARARQAAHVEADRRALPASWSTTTSRPSGCTSPTAPRPTSSRARDAVNGVRLKDGRLLPCQVFLAAVGIKPNAELAKEAGIEVNRGIVVDDRMATSVPGVYAVGDVAEHNGMVLGLWPIAAKQGEVAAMNALGGDETLTAEVPACILKGAGIELSSIGRIDPEPGDELIVIDNPERALLPPHGRVEREGRRRGRPRAPPGGLLGHAGRGQEGDRGRSRHAGRPARRRVGRAQGIAGPAPRHRLTRLARLTLTRAR